MNEYFCIGFAVGVLLALVQPLLWATVNKWKKKEPEPAQAAPVVDTARPTGKQWSYHGFRFSYGWQHIYTLTDFDGLEPKFVATISHLEKDTQGYWRFFRKNGEIEESIANLTFEQVCGWAKDRTGVDGPKPVHLKAVAGAHRHYMARA